jgi:hypothetical protein
MPTSGTLLLPAGHEEVFALNLPEGAFGGNAQIQGAGATLTVNATGEIYVDRGGAANADNWRGLDLLIDGIGIEADYRVQVEVRNPTAAVQQIIIQHAGVGWAPIDEVFQLQPGATFTLAFTVTAAHIADQGAPHAFRVRGGATTNFYVTDILVSRVAAGATQDVVFNLATDAWSVGNELVANNSTVTVHTADYGAFTNRDFVYVSGRAMNWHGLDITGVTGGETVRITGRRGANWQADFAGNSNIQLQDGATGSTPGGGVPGSTFEFVGTVADAATSFRIAVNTFGGATGTEGQRAANASFYIYSIIVGFNLGQDADPPAATVNLTATENFWPAAIPPAALTQAEVNDILFPVRDVILGRIALLADPLPSTQTAVALGTELIATFAANNQVTVAHNLSITGTDPDREISGYVTVTLVASILSEAGVTRSVNIPVPRDVAPVPATTQGILDLAIPAVQAVLDGLTAAATQTSVQNAINAALPAATFPGASAVATVARVEPTTDNTGTINVSVVITVDPAGTTLTGSVVTSVPALTRPQITIPVIATTVFCLSDAVMQAGISANPRTQVVGWDPATTFLAQGGGLGEAGRVRVYDYSGYYHLGLTLGIGNSNLLISTMHPALGLTPGATYYIRVQGRFVGGDATNVVLSPDANNPPSVEGSFVSVPVVPGGDFVLHGTFVAPNAAGEGGIGRFIRLGAPGSAANEIQVFNIQIAPSSLDGASFPIPAPPAVPFDALPEAVTNITDYVTNNLINRRPADVAAVLAAVTARLATDARFAGIVATSCPINPLVVVAAQRLDPPAGNGSITGAIVLTLGADTETIPFTLVIPYIPDTHIPTFPALPADTLFSVSGDTAFQALAHEHQEANFSVGTIGQAGLSNAGQVVALECPFTQTMFLQVSGRNANWNGVDFGVGATGRTLQAGQRVIVQGRIIGVPPAGARIQLQRPGDGYPTLGSVAVTEANELFTITATIDAGVLPATIFRVNTVDAPDLNFFIYDIILAGTEPTLEVGDELWRMSTDTWIQSRPLGSIDAMGPPTADQETYGPAHLQGAGASREIVASPTGGRSILVYDRNASWNGLDVLLYPLGVEPGVMYRVTFSGRIPASVPAGSMQINLADSPWSNMASAPGGATWSVSLTFSLDTWPWDGTPGGDNNRIRLQAPATVTSFIIDEIVFERLQVAVPPPPIILPPPLPQAPPMPVQQPVTDVNIINFGYWLDGVTDIAAIPWLAPSHNLAQTGHRVDIVEGRQGNYIAVTQRSSENQGLTILRNLGNPELQAGDTIVVRGWVGNNVPSHRASMALSIGPNGRIVTRTASVAGRPGSRFALTYTLTDADVAGNFQGVTIRSDHNNDINVPIMDFFVDDIRIMRATTAIVVLGEEWRFSQDPFLQSRPLGPITGAELGEVEDYDYVQHIQSSGGSKRMVAHPDGGGRVSIDIFTRPDNWNGVDVLLYPLGLQAGVNYRIVVQGRAARGNSIEIRLADSPWSTRDGSAVGSDGTFTVSYDFTLGSWPWDGTPGGSNNRIRVAAAAGVPFIVDEIIVQRLGITGIGGAAPMVEARRYTMAEDGYIRGLDVGATTSLAGTANLSPDGGVTVTVVDNDGVNALHVTGRSANSDGININVPGSRVVVTGRAGDNWPTADRSIELLHEGAFGGQTVQNFNITPGETFEISLAVPFNSVRIIGNTWGGASAADMDFFIYTIEVFHMVEGEAAPVEDTPVVTPVVPVEAVVTTRTVLRFGIGSTTYTRDGAPRSIDAAPFIDAAVGRTMVPVRFVAEELLGQDAVDFIPATDTSPLVVLIEGDGVSLQLPVGTPLPGGMGTPVIVDGRTFVPLRFVVDALGAYDVRFDEDSRAVYVYL